MQTITFVGFLVVVAFAAMHAPQPAAGQCCTNVVQFITNGLGGSNVCNDCTRPTPYCGYGKCNLFGCNCDGGCREGNCQRRKRSVNGVVVPVKAIYSNASTIVAAGDVNGDGALSMNEAHQLLKRCGMRPTRRTLQAMDVNGDGKLTPREIDPPKG